MILFGELLIFLGNMKGGMMVHALTLILIILLSIYIDNKIYPALILLPLFRLLNVAMPVFFHLTVYSYSLVYAPMFIPIYFLLKQGTISPSQAGLTTKGFWFYLPLAVAVGFALGWGEQNILQSGTLIPDSGFRNVMILSLTMIVFVGFVEEFIFRSALQTVMETRLGSVAGLLITSIIFGFMHSGYHLPLEIAYVSFAGVVFGLMFWLTRSLLVISLAHGITNISLFLVAPAYPAMLIYFIGIPALLFLLYASLSGRLPRKLDPRGLIPRRDEGLS